MVRKNPCLRITLESSFKNSAILGPNFGESSPNFPQILMHTLELNPKEQICIITFLVLIYFALKISSNMAKLVFSGAFLRKFLCFTSKHRETRKDTRKIPPNKDSTISYLHFRDIFIISSFAIFSESEILSSKTRVFHCFLNVFFDEKNVVFEDNFSDSQKIASDEMIKMSQK